MLRPSAPSNTFFKRFSDGAADSASAASNISLARADAAHDDAAHGRRQVFFFHERFHAGKQLQSSPIRANTRTHLLPIVTPKLVAFGTCFLGSHARDA